MRKTQQGASYITILLGVMAFAFIAKIIVAVWPSYWDDRVINNQITELMKDSTAEMTPLKFSSQMGRRLEMNNIRDIHFDDIASVSTQDGLSVAKKYEIRKHFLLNIDLVLTFEKNFDQRSAENQ
ncbi:DUF4845 domain-containing protein [Acinetobacter sp. WZC-1]|uniref:DUF4845 domain-containing protein n=1 Tax=Acinetobacter sp. WZC-1 TaxID=3459034 RepID=UPI00403DAC4C